MSLLDRLQSLCGTGNAAASTERWALPVSDALFEWIECHRDGGDFSTLEPLLFPCRESAAHLGGKAIHAVVFAASGSSAAADAGVFPGPLCSPFRRAHETWLRSMSYTFTEKSDGLRVVALVLRMKAFPQWASTNSGGQTRTYSNLADVARLEGILSRLRSGERVEVDMTDGVRYACEVAAEGAEADVYQLSPLAADPGVTSVCEQPETVAVRRTAATRYVSLCIDRSMDAAYLLLDSPETPLLPSVDRAVLDGELCCAVRTLDEARTMEDALRRGASLSRGSFRLVLAIFDLYVSQGDDEPEASRLHDTTLTRRYETLKELFTCPRPLGNMDDEAALTLSHSGVGSTFIPWFVKRMWPVADLLDCLKRLTSCGGVYWFRGPFGLTRNDGFIFTPDAFPIRSGAARYQVKWKWQPLLSVDWQLTLLREGSDEYQAALYFSKVNHGFRDDVKGHWAMDKPMRVRNPHSFSITAQTPVIAECCYSQEHGMWTIERLRGDKDVANSITTAISVYESIAENLVLRELCGLLGLQDAPELRAVVSELDPPRIRPPNAGTGNKAAKGQGKTKGKDAPRHRSWAKLLLRAVAGPDKRVKLNLVWMTNGTNSDHKWPIPCAFSEVRESNGLGLVVDKDGFLDGGNLDLEKYLYIELANRGGSCSWTDFLVDAYFDGALGRWVVLKAPTGGDKRMANFAWLLEHLQWVIEHGGGNVATKHLPPFMRNLPPAHIPRSFMSSTEATNQHYAQKSDELGMASGEKGPEGRSALRGLNNWVKTQLLNTAALRIQSSPSTSEGETSVKLRVADLCCGRGGDLLKWRNLKPSFLFMTDSSFDCVAEAAGRYSVQAGLSTKSREAGVEAHFEVHDAFDPASKLRSALTELRKNHGPFTLASCQFSIHYGCASRERLGYFFDCVADCLAEGGLFVGTTVSDAELIRRYQAEGCDFGSPHFHIHLPDESVRVIDAYLSAGGASGLPFGVGYDATVEKSVTQLREYIVPWDAFVQMAAERRLHVTLDEPLVDFANSTFSHERDSDLLEKFLPQGKRPRPVDDDEHISATPVTDNLTEDERQAASLYRVFILERRA